MSAAGPGLGSLKTAAGSHSQRVTELPAKRPLARFCRHHNSRKRPLHSVKVVFHLECSFHRSHAIQTGGSGGPGAEADLLASGPRSRSWNPNAPIEAKRNAPGDYYRDCVVAPACRSLRHLAWLV